MKFERRLRRGTSDPGRIFIATSVNVPRRFHFHDIMAMKAAWLDAVSFAAKDNFN